MTHFPAGHCLMSSLEEEGIFTSYLGSLSTGCCLAGEGGQCHVMLHEKERKQNFSAWLSDSHLSFIKFLPVSISFPTRLGCCGYMGCQTLCPVVGRKSGGKRQTLDMWTVNARDTLMAHMS